MRFRTVYKYKLFFLVILINILSIGLTYDFSYGNTCAYFNETFTGTASNTWNYNYGTWAIKNNKLNVSNITSGKSAYINTGFLPSNYFSIDVDVNSVSALQGEGYSIYPYTSGSTYFSVDGKNLDGIGAVFFSSGDAYLIGWDMTNQTWYQSSKYATTPPVTSIGVAYSDTAITLRINKQDTTLKFSGNFTNFYQMIDSIDLMAQGSSTLFQTGTEVNFDNVCADPLATSGGSTGTVTLLSPANGATNQTLTPALSWSATGSPTAYRIFAATDENTLKNLAADASTCSSCVLTTNTGTTANYTFSSGILQAGTKYYWRVKSAYDSGPVLSETWSFTTVAGGNTCTATIDPSLKLTIPIIKYTDSLLGSIYLWANMNYVLNSSKVLFKLSDYGINQNVSGYSCTMSTLDTDLTIHVNELLYNGSNFWLKLAYDTSLSSGNNAYFYAADYGSVAPSEAIDVTELISSLFGAAGRYNPTTSPAIIETVKTTYQTGGVAALINLAVTAYPQLVKEVPNGILIDFGNGYITKNGATMTGSIEITHSNVVRTGRRTTGDFAIVAKNVHKDTKFLGDGSASGTVDLTSDANNKVTGDITINGLINSSGGLRAPQTNEIVGANSSGTSGTVTGSAHFDEIQCPNYPVSGGITFTLNGQTQAITFNDKCNGSYAINGITQGGSTIITSLSPNSGKPGDTVTITGSGFGTTQGSSTVKFVGTTATVVSWSATSIVVTVPNIPSTGDVIVNVGGADSNGVTFTVVNQCSTQQVAGKDTPETRVIDLGINHGTFRFDYDTQVQKDRITVTYEGTALFDTGCVGTAGTKTQNITYSGSATSVTVTVQPNCAGGTGTAWSFKVYCP